MTLDLNPKEVAFLLRQTHFVIRNLKVADDSRIERGLEPFHTDRIAFLSNLATKLETASC